MAVKINITSTEIIGQLIRFHRKKARLSRLDLADIAGVGKTVIYDIEKGKKTLRMDTLFKILAALNISVKFDSPLMNRFMEQEHAKG